MSNNKKKIINGKIDQKTIKIGLLKTGVRLTVRRFLRVLEPNYDFQW